MIIVHAAHPLRGERLQVVAVRGQQQETTQLLIELPGGERRLVPIEWTDRCSAYSYPAGVCFPVENLLRLREKLDELLARHGEASNMAALTEGGSHERGKDRSVAADDGGAAPENDSHSGADATAADESKCEGGER